MGRFSVEISLGCTKGTLDGILEGDSLGGILESDSGKGYREGRFVRSLNAASGRISNPLNLKEISGGF